MSAEIRDGIHAGAAGLSSGRHKDIDHPGLADGCFPIACARFHFLSTGQLILAGVGPDGRLSFNEQNYARATGLCFDRKRLFVASMFQIWRLENMLEPGQYANKAYDFVLVPRSANTVNYVDAHEIAVDRDDRPIFVNSRYSCLATFDQKHSFRPIWKPSFISNLAPETCH